MITLSRKPLTTRPTPAILSVATLAANRRGLPRNMNEMELLHVMQKELPDIRRRLCSPDPVVATAAIMRMDDLIGLLQRRVQRDHRTIHRAALGFVGLSVGRDD